MKIYLSGAMSGIDLKTQLEWRNELAHILSPMAECYNPPAHFSDQYIDNHVMDASGYKSDREVMNYDLWQLRSSDLVIVNFAYNPQSLGTMAEIAIAYELRIPVLGFGIDPNELHPWQRDMCERIFKTSTDLLVYICSHYQ